jgi:hypothetical protein
MWNYTPHAFVVCNRVTLLLQNTNEVTIFCDTNVMFTDDGYKTHDIYSYLFLLAVSCLVSRWSKPIYTVHGQSVDQVVHGQ